MQTKPFWKLLLTGIGYMALGNLMSTVMTVAASVVANITPLMILLFILTLFVFYSLCFTAAYKDGQNDRVMYKNHRIESVSYSKWTKIGFIMLAVMSIPSILLFIFAQLKIFISCIIPYRMICGMIYPLALAMGADYSNISFLPSYYPFIFAGCYIFIPLATYLGFKFGVEDRFNPDKIMYEKK